MAYHDHATCTFHLHPLHSTLTPRNLFSLTMCAESAAEESAMDQWLLEEGLDECKRALHDEGFETMVDLCEFTKAEDIASSIKVTVPAIRGMFQSLESCRISMHSFFHTTHPIHSSLDDASCCRTRHTEADQCTAAPRHSPWWWSMQQQQAG